MWLHEKVTTIHIHVKFQGFVKNYLVQLVRLLLGIDQARGSGYLSSVGKLIIVSLIRQIWLAADIYEIFWI